MKGIPCLPRNIEVESSNLTRTRDCAGKSCMSKCPLLSHSIPSLSVSLALSLSLSMYGSLALSPLCISLSHSLSLSLSSTLSLSLSPLSVSLPLYLSLPPLYLSFRAMYSNMNYVTRAMELDSYSS